MKSSLVRIILGILVLIIGLGFTFSPISTVSKGDYYRIINDGRIDNYETLVLYNDYYTPSPDKFIASATWFGSDNLSYVEISHYGDVIRQQMWRGWVLVGSGEYGYHNSLSGRVKIFLEKYYPQMRNDDYLLSKQASPMYYYFADGGLFRTNRDTANQPIEVTYEELNDNQKRIYDITSVPDYKIEELFIDKEQYKQRPEDALKSGKYSAIVSSKSPNDLGRIFLIYKRCGDLDIFYGVVLVGGVAKRDDWTGLGKPTSETFRWYNHPLIIRETDGQHWGFDFPTSIYEWFGGNGGPVTNIIAMSPDDYLTSEEIYAKMIFK